LDISDSSSKAELKAAFRAAMLRLHPDKISQSGLDPEKATEMSKFLLTVRDTLSDFEKKNSYDIQHSDLWKDSSSDGDSSDLSGDDGFKGAGSTDHLSNSLLRHTEGAGFAAITTT
jgi:DnaJ-class molecular chaperone